MKPALRVRIPPPKQATTGNGQDDGIPNILRRMPAGAEKKPQQLDPAEVEIDDDLNDEINM